MTAPSCQARFPMALVRMALLGAASLAGVSATAANLSISSATATFAQSFDRSWAPSEMIDGTLSGSNGWAIYRNLGAESSFSETALFTLTAPLAAGPQSLTFTIYQNYGSSHVLGTFSLAYANDAAPGLLSTQTAVSISSGASLVGGTVLTPSGGSLAVTGTLQNTDVYTITASINSLTPVTGFFLNAIDTNGDLLVGGGPGRQPSNGNFVVSEFTVAAVPVPEPSTWAMMLGGLGLVGALAMRGRRLD